ncbi:MAG: hypothetical protein ABIV39_07435 [Verrucomicrobiota bacterium]
MPEIPLPARFKSPIGCRERIGGAVHAGDADLASDMFVSMESAMTSRATREYFMPSLPIAQA